MMTGYTEVTVIVDGALEVSETFDDDDTHGLDTFLARQKAFAEHDGAHTQVYLLHHPHRIWAQGWCSCIQYVTDHRPDYEWNALEED